MAVAAVEVERVGLVGEPAEEEVVDHLLDEVADVLDQGDLPVDVARRPEAVEDLQAEPVRRLDGRGVEVGDGLAQPVAAGLDLVGRPVGQQLHELVVVVAALAGRGCRPARRRRGPAARAPARAARRSPCG